MPTAIPGSPQAPFSCAFVRPVRFGVLAGVHLSPEARSVEEEVLARLHPDEAAQARSLKVRRQIEWTGGRLAYRIARGDGSPSWEPLLSGAGGEPIGPSDQAVSLSHKSDLALALVGRRTEGTLGVDLETLGRERLAIASHVLGPEEQEQFKALPGGEQWRHLVSVFSLKEATYKAIYPHVRRYVAFTEARVELGSAPQIELFLREPSVPLRLEADLEFLGDRLIACVRCMA